jgi:hypothetical protein
MTLARHRGRPSARPWNEQGHANRPRKNAATVPALLHLDHLPLPSVPPPYPPGASAPPRAHADGNLFSCGRPHDIERRHAPGDGVAPATRGSRSAADRWGAVSNPGHAAGHLRG